jgi:hypothetical protein
MKAMGAGAGIVAIGSRVALAQAPTGPVAPPSTVTSPPRDFSRNGAPTTYFTDPDVISVDPSFDGYAQPNGAITCLWTGALWSEGPAWNAQGRYLVWSDIPNNRQLRWLEDDGRVSVFRMPSNNSNGNTFDFQGRQLSCEHLTRRVVRYELDGSVTVIADSYDGKRLNSPNDIVPHPDGSYWFTDPPYGGQLYEGAPDAGGGPSNAAGRLKPRLGQAAEIGGLKRELPTNCYSTSWSDPIPTRPTISPRNRSAPGAAPARIRRNTSILKSTPSWPRAPERSTRKNARRRISRCRRSSTTICRICRSSNTRWSRAPRRSSLATIRTSTSRSIPGT